jgi:colicin import membrane protein
MNASTLTHWRPKSTEAWGRGATLALLVHGALIVALAFGVSWRSREPAGVEAELWGAIPQLAAPKIETPVPQPAPPPQPKVAPAPTPAPAPAADAEIALEKAKRERLAREKAEELKKAEALKRAEELKKAEAAEREAQRKRQAEEAALAKQREDNLKRITAQAGGTGPATSTGTAAQSAGPSATYAGRLKARIKPNIVLTDDVAGNPEAEVEVRAAPDGTIVGRRIVKSSGVKAWDDAVLRAIDRTEVLPRDVDGRVPSPIVIAFKRQE